jgi:DMSO reductase anchor subunit
MASGKFMKWLAISLYIAFLLFAWLDYFMKLTGSATVEGALLYTIIVPLVTFAGFKIYHIKSPKVWEWYWTAWGVLFLGFLIFAIVNLLLMYALPLPAWREWEWDNVGFRIAFTLPLSYVIGGYLGYTFGKSRGFGPLIF